MVQLFKSENCRHGRRVLVAPAFSAHHIVHSPWLLPSFGAAGIMKSDFANRTSPSKMFRVVLNRKTTPQRRRLNMPSRYELDAVSGALITSSPDLVPMTTKLGLLLLPEALLKSSSCLDISSADFFGSGHITLPLYRILSPPLFMFIPSTLAIRCCAVILLVCRNQPAFSGELGTER